MPHIQFSESPMKKHPLYYFVVVVFCICLFSACSSCSQKVPNSSSGSTAVLVFSKTSEFYHKSIPAGVAAIQTLGQQNNFTVDTTKDASYFTADSLKNYAAVIFLNTTGNVLNPEQEKAFENYINGGGGFVGIHSATDTEKDWPWYNELVGAQFANHPKIQEATVVVRDTTHPSTHFLPQKWSRNDEWYNFKNIYPEIEVLAILDESSYSGGTNGEEHPIAWYHETKGGRAFYTAGGHTDESYQEPLFLQHILGGIRYAIGEENPK